MAAVALFIFGLSYASVPLYKVFCQMTGFGGTTQRADDVQATTVKPLEGAAVIRVDFTGDVHAAMPWSFRPTQKDIQCFCFEEQRLGPGEEIDMPVFFFLDPEIAEDPAMRSLKCITLSYTFFKTGEE
eukprot:GSChrysophyteH1.ASY1.ANO1.2094.1 assembled CDS